jgi:hypothetical protein
VAEPHARGKIICALLVYPFQVVLEFLGHCDDGCDMILFDRDHSLVFSEPFDFCQRDGSLETCSLTTSVSGSHSMGLPTNRFEFLGRSTPSLADLGLL